MNDFQKRAEARLSKHTYEFIQDHSDSGATRDRNIKAFSLYKLKQRVLQGKLTPHLDISTSLFGMKISSPVGISPTASHKIAHPDGEEAVARVVEKTGNMFTLSGWAQTLPEKVAELAPNAFRFCHVNKTMVKNEKFLETLEKLGYKGIVVTIDNAIGSRRRYAMKNDFTMPAHLKFQLILKHAEVKPNPGESFTSYYIRSNAGFELTWDTIRELRSITSLKIILKGILCKEDAATCLEFKKEGIIDALWISNHGGRQLDETISTVEALDEIAPVVAGQMPIIVDGGFRSGTDVLKALGLGADFVCLGRPILYGLASAGEAGVEKVLGLIESELKRAMALTGVKSIKEAKDKNILYKMRPKL